MTTSTKTKKKLVGDLKPRLHSPWLKGKSRVDEVEKFAESIGMPLLKWQSLILKDMLTVDAKNMFIKRSILLLIARQSGKSHLARMRVLAGLFCFGEKDILIMSSNRSMALKSFNIMVDIIERNAFLLAQLKGGSVKKGDGARGRTADLLWIDELREVSEVAMDASKSVTLTRPNSQRIFTSNAGDAFSKVLNDLHEQCLSYPPKSLGFYEYSAPAFCDIWDRKAWAMANPSLGYLIDETAIEETIATSTIEAARTETLCQWISSLTSPWTPNSWEDICDRSMEMFPGPLTMFGFDIDMSRRNAALMAGQILPDGRIGVSLVQTWESPISVDELKIAADIKGWCDQYKPRLVLYDRYSTLAVAERLQNAGVMVETIVGPDFYAACSTLKDAIDNKRVAHAGQEVLDQQMNNCGAKSTDSSWRIVRKASSGPIVAPISLVMLVAKLSQPQSKPMIVA
jgi:phage terminase large subunit-like protein